MTSSLKVVFAAITLAAAAMGAAQDIQVQVDGTRVIFANAQPQYINGRVLVPLRGVFEELGATVNWDQSTRMVDAMKGTSNVRLRIGDKHAVVNGADVTLDVPAMVVRGSTMVPIRFISEALGAQVGWIDAQQLVTINTSAAQTGTISTPPRRLRRAMVRENEVIPVVLDDTLSSVDNKKGDTFTATVRSSDSDEFADLPHGTKIEGHIAAVHPMRNGKPAILDLTFDRIRFANGHAAKIEGSLISLDNKHVTQKSNGVLIAKTNDNGDGKTDQRMVYAGYGAGAGLLVGVLTKRPLETTVLGGALGYILGQVQHDQRKATNITLNPGTEMGVKVNREVAISW